MRQRLGSNVLAHMVDDEVESWCSVEDAGDVDAEGVRAYSLREEEGCVDEGAAGLPK